MSQNLSFETAHNVNVNYELADVGHRLGAHLLDSVFKLVYAFIILMIIGMFPSSVSESNVIWMIILIALPVYLYRPFFEYFNKGQTPAKQILNLQVSTIDGSPLRLSHIIFRWLFCFIDIQLMSGLVALICIASTEKRQRVGDMVAGTTVIKLKSGKSLEDTAYRKVTNDYLPVYEEVRNMSQHDIQIVQEVIQNYGQNRIELMKSLSEKIEDTYQINRTEAPPQFLKTIIRDYNYFEQNV